ncbi:Sugar transporter [Duganella sp. CF402]|uniref:MFS transporter n=1 Tax=unclassified Duganella TaxID=2636909 RepID=UPI0008BD603E|nr:MULTISPECIES: MFS transporter [unclassified Duganella]RZT11319.1 sugar transport protein [Duganella sp. BK701]SEK70593.1 Sugar transporter [Duganella sp. CF402]
MHSPENQTRYLLLVAGLGGLLYGIDVGIIAGALPYLEASAVQLWKLSSQQLGFVVAAVLLGSVLSSLAAGALAEAWGRKKIMFISGLLFSLSIPVIALADGYVPLLLGRLLQGVSGGLIGVVVPLYLAESLPAAVRGRGTAIFQLLLTIGLVLAAAIGLLVAHQVEQAAHEAPAALQAVQDAAWRRIFWLSLAPGLLFTAGVVWLAESPRWLLAHGRTADALQALRRTRPAAEADAELAAIDGAGESRTSSKGSSADSLLQRRYVLPFLLACLILACNQATGINSVLAYAVTILDQGGLSGSMGNVGDFALKLLNALVTVLAVILVDRKGRKFLLMLGSGGIVVSLLAAALLFRIAESGQSDAGAALSQRIQDNALQLDAPALRALAGGEDYQLDIAYSYGPLTQVRSLRPGDALRITPPDSVEGDSVIGAAFRQMHLNPFPDMNASLQAPLQIERARIGPRPQAAHGWLLLACLLGFIASFAVGPGVCVWLALSELMPTRIRSNGMSIALLVNQFVSTVLAAVFLPVVSLQGYAPMFFFWAGCTVVYFLAATFLLPETRGKTLEEINRHFAYK